jgi:hypothetical protein
MMRFQYLRDNYLSAALAILALGLLAFSCAKEPAYDGPHLSIRTTEADFGTIQSNDPVAFHDVTITLTNPGSERLEIENVELPEGFSYAFIPRKSIRSGGKISLKITMDRRKFSGEVAETAHILSNDPAQPKAAIALVARIVGDSAAPPTGGAKGPDIELDHNSHIFGTVARSQAVEHSFPVKNVGTKVLKIRHIETTCLCATARATKSELQPGESAEIIAKLEPYKYPGHDPQKTLSVVTNDPDEPAVPLTILAFIVDMVELEPEEILLPNLRAGQPASAEARIIQDGAMDLDIKQIESSSPMISVDTRPLEGDRKGHILAITISPEMPEGAFEESITITTNYSDYTDYKRMRGGGLELYKNYKKLQLPVKGAIKGTISVVPRSVNFGSVSPGESQQRKLVVSGDTPFEIESVSLADSALSASFGPAAAGIRHEISIQFLAEGPGRKINDKLIISTSGGELTVAVFAAVKPGS